MCYKFIVEDEVSGNELGLSGAYQYVATSPTTLDGPKVFAATARGCTWIMKLDKETDRRTGENVMIMAPCHVASPAEIDTLRRQQADCLAGCDNTHIPWGYYLPTEAIAEDSTGSHRSILRRRGACQASKRVSFSPEVKDDEGCARRCGRDRIGYIYHLDSSHKIKALHIKVVDGTSDLVERRVVCWFEEKMNLKVESMILSPDSRGACVIFADSDTAYQALLCLHSLMNAAKTNHCELHDSCVLVKSLSGVEDQEGFDEAVLSTGRYILEELEGDDHREFNRRRRQGPFIPSPRQWHTSLDDTSTFPATKSAGGEWLKRSGNRFSILNPVASNDKIEQDHGRMDPVGGFAYASTLSLSSRRHSSKSASSLPRGWATSTSSRAETDPESSVIYKRLSRMARRNRSRTTNQHKLRSFQKNKPLKDTPGDADELRRIFDDARALKENANRHLHPEPSFVYRGYFNGNGRNGRHECRRNYRRKRRIQRRMRNAMLSPFGLDSAPKPPEVEVQHWAREWMQRRRLWRRGPGMSITRHGKVLRPPPPKALPSEKKRVKKQKQRRRQKQRGRQREMAFPRPENESEDHRFAQPCAQRCCSGRASFLPTELLATPVGGDSSQQEITDLPRKQSSARAFLRAASSFACLPAQIMLLVVASTTSFVPFVRATARDAFLRAVLPVICAVAYGLTRIVLWIIAISRSFIHFVRALVLEIASSSQKCFHFACVSWQALVSGLQSPHRLPRMIFRGMTLLIRVATGLLRISILNPFRMIIIPILLVSQDAHVIYRPSTLVDLCFSPSSQSVPCHAVPHKRNAEARHGSMSDLAILAAKRGEKMAGGGCCPPVFHHRCAKPLRASKLKVLGDDLFSSIADAGADFVPLTVFETWLRWMVVGHFRKEDRRIIDSIMAAAIKISAPLDGMDVVRREAFVSWYVCWRIDESKVRRTATVAAEMNIDDVDRVRTAPTKVERLVQHLAIDTEDEEHHHPVSKFNFSDLPEQKEQNSFDGIQLDAPVKQRHSRRSASYHGDTGELGEITSIKSGLPLMSQKGADALADRLVKSSDASAMARSIAGLLYLSEQIESETPNGVIATGTSDLKQKLSVLPLPAAQMESIGQEGAQAGAEITKDAINNRMAGRTSITRADFGRGKRSARVAASPKRLSPTKRSTTDKSQWRTAPSSNSRRTIQLLFKDQYGKKKVIDVAPAGTIADVKQAIFHSTCIPPESQRLVFNCKDLRDPMTVDFYNISGGSEISLNVRFLGGDPHSLGPKGGDMIEEFRQFICILKEEFDKAKEKKGDSNGGELDAWIYILKSPSGLQYGRENEAGKHWYSSSMAMHNIFLDPAAPIEQKTAFIDLLQKYLRKECKGEDARQGQSVLREDFFSEFQMAECNLKEKKSIGSKKAKYQHPGYSCGVWCLNFSTHANSVETERFRLNYDIKESIHRDLGRYKKWSRKEWIDRAVERFHSSDSLSDDDVVPPMLEDDGYDNSGYNVVHTIAEEGVSGQNYEQGDGDDSGMARGLAGSAGSALTVVPNAPLEDAAASALVTPTNPSATDPRLSSDEEATLKELLERPGAYEIAMKACCKEEYQKGDTLSGEEWKLLSHLLRRADSVKMQGNSVALKMRHRTRGQRSWRKYYRAPPRRKRSRKGTSVREIAKIFKDMTVDADVDIKDCIRRVSKKFLKDEDAVFIKKLTKEESVVASIAFRKACNIYSGRQYERLREYIHIDVFAKSHRIYSSLQSQRKYFRKKSPKESYYDEMIYMDVGTKKNRKVKLCHVWHSKFPLELVSTEMTRIFSTGRFRSSEEFSNSSDHFVYFGMNSDKAEKCISVMGRILNEPRANQAENNILFAQTSGNASENYFNMHRFLCRVTPRHKRAMGGEITKHVMHEFKQAAFDDEIVYLYLDLDSESSLESKKVAIAFLMKSQDGQEVDVSMRASDDLIAFESLSNEALVNTETDASHRKYLKRSSYRMMRVKSADDVALIRDESSDAIIGIAGLNSDGDIDTWVRLPEYHKDFKVKSVKARRQIGLECSDGKMACTLAGHQGYSATYPCPICLWKPAGGLTRGKMESLLDTESPLRWGEYDNHRMFEAGKDMPDATPDQKAEKVAVNKNINKEPLFRIHPCKKHCGIMHGEMGCFSHVEKRMIKNLKKIEDDTNLAGSKATWTRQKLTEQLITLKDAEQNLRKDVRNRVAAIKGWEKKLEEHEKQAEQEKLEKGEVTKNTQYLIERRREDVDPTGKIRKDLALREDALKNLQIKIEAHTDSIQTIDEYADRRSTEKDSEMKNAVAGKGGTNHYILVNILDEAYAAQGVPLGQHHGGRAIIHRHFVKLLCRWDVIMEWVIATLESRFPNIFNIDKIKEELFYASDIMFELAQITRIQSSQNKLDEDTIKSLETHWNSYVKKLYQRYPQSNPFFKVHNGVAHLSKAAKYLGFLGLANEQGFEAWHAYFNRMLPTLQSIRNHADRSQVLRQFCVGGASDEIKNWQQRVDDKRIKRVRKSKVDKTDITSLREVSIRNFLEAFRFQADTYDGIDGDQFDAAIIDVDKLTDLQVEVELRVRNKDTSGSRDECRKRLKDVVATEAGEDDNDAAEVLPTVEQDNQESDDAPPSSEQRDCGDPDDPTTAVEIQDVVEPAPSMLLSRCLETPSYLKNKATDDIRVFKCHLCDRHIPEDGLAYHIIVHHDACEALPTVGDDADEGERSDVSAVSASDIEDMGIDELTALCNENAIPTGGNVTAAKMRSELIKALFPVDDDGGDDGDDGEDDYEEDSEEAPVSEAARRRRDVLRICALTVRQLKKELKRRWRESR